MATQVIALSPFSSRPGIIGAEAAGQHDDKYLRAAILRLAHTLGSGPAVIGNVFRIRGTEKFIVVDGCVILHAQQIDSDEKPVGAPVLRVVGKDHMIVIPPHTTYTLVVDLSATLVRVDDFDRSRPYNTFPVAKHRIDPIERVKMLLEFFAQGSHAQDGIHHYYFAGARSLTLDPEKAVIMTETESITFDVVTLGEKLVLALRSVGAQY